MPPVILPAQPNLPQFALLLRQVPFAAIIGAEGIASSSHLSLEEEIENFHFVKEDNLSERPVEVLDSETESDKLSIAHQPGQVIALVETSSEEVENMDIKKRPGLRSLITNRGKGETPLEAPKAQVSANHPLPPPPADLILRVNPNLKKRKPFSEMEEGEMLPQRGTKQQKTKDP